MDSHSQRKLWRTLLKLAGTRKRSRRVAQKDKRDTISGRDGNQLTGSLCFLKCLGATDCLKELGHSYRLGLLREQGVANQV